MSQSTIHPAVAGVLAAALTLLLFSSWIAIGSLLVSAGKEAVALRLTWSTILGSAATSLILTAFAVAGAARQGAVIVFVAGIAALVVQRRHVLAELKEAGSRVRESFGERPVDRLVVAIIVAVLLVQAIAPPRDGDVVRYHLAHIRQIAFEGSWRWVPDVTYAFPFAWSFNYLPFEVLGLPQGAALLNVFLWAMLFVLLVETIGEARPRSSTALLCLCFLAHPFIVKIFSAAFADGFAILVTTAVAVALARAEKFDARSFAILGFTCWIAVGSRYQMVAVGIIGSIVSLTYLLRSRDWAAARWFAAGTGVALLVSSPFYLMNWKGSGNPFWPLLVSGGEAGTSYQSEVAARFSARFTDWNSLEIFGHLARRLFTASYLAPLPLALVILCIVGCVLVTGPRRRAALVGAGFLALWVAMSPGIYPTHFLPILGLGPLLAAWILSERKATAQLLHKNVLRVVVIVWTSLAAVFSWDYARYVITGNADEYHRFTWYYPVYDWINHKTPADAKFLVIVYSGLTYYLDRPYRRADPWLTAEVDWNRVTTPAQLDSVLAEGGYDYLVYDDRDWSGQPGGENTVHVVHQAVAERRLVPAYHSRERLYTGRVRRASTESDIYVFKRADR